MIQIEFVKAKDEQGICISFIPTVVYEKTISKYANYCALSFVFLYFGIKFSWDKKTANQ